MVFRGEDFSRYFFRLQKYGADVGTVLHSCEESVTMRQGRRIGYRIAVLPEQHGAGGMPVPALSVEIRLSLSPIADLSVFPCRGTTVSLQGYNCFPAGVQLFPSKGTTVSLQGYTDKSAIRKGQTGSCGSVSACTVRYVPDSIFRQAHENTCFGMTYPQVFFSSVIPAHGRLVWHNWWHYNG